MNKEPIFSKGTVYSSRSNSINRCKKYDWERDKRAITKGQIIHVTDLKV